MAAKTGSKFRGALSVNRGLRLKFKKRKDCIFKKTMELSVLADVKACAVFISPDGNVETWPQNHTEFNSILSLYKAKSQENKPFAVKKGPPAAAAAVSTPEAGATDVKTQETSSNDFLKKLTRAMDEFGVWANGFCSRELMSEILKIIEAKLEFLDQKVKFLKQIDVDSKGKEVVAYGLQGEAFYHSAANHQNTNVVPPASCSSSCWYDMDNTEAAANSYATTYVYQPQPLQSFETSSYLDAETGAVMIYDGKFMPTVSGKTSGNVSSSTDILEGTKFDSVVSDNSSNQVSTGDISLLENDNHKDLNDDWFSLESDLMILEGIKFDFLYGDWNDIGKQYWSLGGFGDILTKIEAPEFLDQKVEFLNQIETNTKGKEIAEFEQQADTFSPSSCSSSCWYDMYNSTEATANFDAITYVYQPPPLQSFEASSYSEEGTGALMINDNKFVSGECGGTSSKVTADYLKMEETKFNSVVTEDISKEVTSTRNFVVLGENTKIDEVLNDNGLGASDLITVDEIQSDYSCNNVFGFGKQYWVMPGNDGIFGQQSCLLNNGDSGEFDLMRLEETEFDHSCNNENDIGGFGNDMYAQQSPLDQLVLSQMFVDLLEPYGPQFD